MAQNQLARTKSKSTQVPHLPYLADRDDHRNLANSRKTEPRQFNLRTVNTPLPTYNALNDRHLKLYFEQEGIKKHIKRMSVANSSARVLHANYGNHLGPGRKKQLNRQQFLQYLSQIRSKLLRNVDSH